MCRVALRSRNLNVNYQPPLLIHSSLLSSPRNVKKHSAKHCIMGDHSGSKCTSFQPPPPPPPPTVVHHWPVIIHDVSLPTTEAQPAILNCEDNYIASDEVCIEQAGLITTDHSAKLHIKILEKPIQNLTDHPELPKFNLVQPAVPSRKLWNQLPISFSKLDAITPIQIFNLFLTNSIMGQLVANTNSYTQQQLLAPKKEWWHSWQPVTAQ